MVGLGSHLSQLPPRTSLDRQLSAEKLVREPLDGQAPPTFPHRTAFWGEQSVKTNTRKQRIHVVFLSMK